MPITKSTLKKDDAKAEVDLTEVEGTEAAEETPATETVEDAPYGVGGVYYINEDGVRVKG
jgi:hypothetical protein